MPKMKSVLSFDNKRIFYSFHEGSRGTLVFLHGWPHNHTAWSAEFDYFAKKGYCVIAPDLRGHGKSDKPLLRIDYKIDNFAKDVYQILVKHKIKDPILIGHSFGGMVILKFQELFPDVARGLVLVDTTYKSPIKSIPGLRNFELSSLSDHVLAHLLKQVHLQKDNFEDVDFSKLRNKSDIFLWFKGAKSIPFNSLVLCLRDMLDFDESKILKEIRIPCLLIEGENDFATPKDVAFEMADKINDSKVFIIKNASHNTNINNSKKIICLIERFMLGL